MGASGRPARRFGGRSAPAKSLLVEQGLAPLMRGLVGRAAGRGGRERGARAAATTAVARTWDVLRQGRAAGRARTLPGMRLEGIRAGDIVEVDRLGRRFHALVGESVDGGLSIEPLDRRVTYRACRPHEVRAHWAKRGRPREAGEPHEDSPLQLELDTAVPDQLDLPERHGG